MPCTANSAENLWKYTEDITNSYWTLVKKPTVTELNGVTTVTKTVETNAYFTKRNFANEAEIIEGNTYVAMGQFKQPTETATAPYIQLNIYWAIDPDTGGTTKASVTARTMELLPWTKLMTVFEAGPTTDFSLNSHSALSSVDFNSLQLVNFPGYGLYSTGDSICEAAYSYTNDPTPVSRVDSGSNYTMVYGYDSRIAFKNAGFPGDLLSEIHARMVADLATATYPMIFIEGGINDIRTIIDTPLATMQSEMSAMITLAKSKSDHVVVFNIPPNSGVNENQLKQQEYNTWLLEECARQGVQHFDMVAVLGTGGGTYGFARNYMCYGHQDPEFADATREIHPNAYGHNKIAVALQEQVTIPSTAPRFGEYIKTEDSVVIDSSNKSMPLWSDQDNDGIADQDDNCPTDPNPRQHDLDGDHIGLACDSDTINDQSLIDRSLSSEARAMAYRERLLRSEQRAMDNDNDNDGYSKSQGDCDDTNSVIYPGATEICGDSIDQDCDGNDLACT